MKVGLEAGDDRAELPKRVTFANFGIVEMARYCHIWKFFVVYFSRGPLEKYTTKNFQNAAQSWGSSWMAPVPRPKITPKLSRHTIERIIFGRRFLEQRQVWPDAEMATTSGKIHD
jgi:hypothetical protein